MGRGKKTKLVGSLNDPETQTAHSRLFFSESVASFCFILLRLRGDEIPLISLCVFTSVFFVFSVYLCV